MRPPNLLTPENSFGENQGIGKRVRPNGLLAQLWPETSAIAMLGFKNRTEVVVVVVMCGCLAWLLWPLIRKGPAGRAIPAFVPDESRRVVNPDGYSIVLPPRWRCVTNTSDLGIFLCPESPIAARSTATMTLFQLRERPSVYGFTETRFRQFVAWERMDVVRESTFDDPAISDYILLINHENGWLRFEYSIAKSRTELPGQIGSYIDTIRLEGRERP